MVKEIRVPVWKYRGTGISFSEETRLEILCGTGMSFSGLCNSMNCVNLVGTNCEESAYSSEVALDGLVFPNSSLDFRTKLAQNQSKYATVFC